MHSRCYITTASCYWYKRRKRKKKEEKKTCRQTDTQHTHANIYVYIYRCKYLCPHYETDSMRSHNIYQNSVLRKCINFVYVNKSNFAFFPFIFYINITPKPVSNSNSVTLCLKIENETATKWRLASV